MSLDNIVDQEVKTDVLIIGSEAAGAKAAIELDERGIKDVVMVTKGLFAKSGVTLMAGSAVQAAIGHMDPRDNPDTYLEDTVKGGGYLVNQKLLEVLARLSLTEVTKLEKWGAIFRKVGDKFLQLQFPGSTYPRTLMTPGSFGGLQWRKAYRSEVLRRRIKVMEEIFITSLLADHEGIAGATGFSLRDGRFILFRPKVVILATGGMIQLFSRCDGPMEATGDGIAMAYKAGCELMDMEFHQFFPTCLYWPLAFKGSTFPAWIRYTLRGHFYNALGEQFMERYLPQAKEWGLRDPTSRAIYLEAKYGRGAPHGGAYLAINHLPRNLVRNWMEREGLEKSQLYKKLKSMGIDITKDAIECGPMSHYSMGGVRVDENCETLIPRLYAVGEVASGMDGAERIDAGSAITWTQTMGYVAAVKTAERLKDLDWLKVDEGKVKDEHERLHAPFQIKEGIRGWKVKREIQNIMWMCCGLVREGKELEEGLKRLERIKGEDIPRLTVSSPSRVFNKEWVESQEAINMAELAEISMKAALMRKESRGSHYRSDYPEEDNRNWLVNIVVKREGEKPVFIKSPPVITKVKP